MSCEPGADVVTAVFRSYETGVRTGTISVTDLLPAFKEHQPNIAAVKWVSVF